MFICISTYYRTYLTRYSRLLFLNICILHVPIY
uniref:Uncharacterized protein n=1 Tax=Geladintestivirus 1 TaxID=3233133 RepID=A0AAU8MGK1_9CAUD